MKSVTKISIIGLLIVLFTSCAKVYYTPDSKVVANNHKKIAIIPPTVSIAAIKHVDGEAIKEQQRTESVNFQNAMYSWMLKRKMQGKMTQEIQELQTTNSTLRKAGFPQSSFTNEELCNILGVDAVITSNFALSKPMSELAAIALLLSGSVNEVHASLGISDLQNKKLIWHYDHKLPGTIGYTPIRLVDRLMKSASKKMPYIN